MHAKSIVVGTVGLRALGHPPTLENVGWEYHSAPIFMAERGAPSEVKWKKGGKGRERKGKMKREKIDLC